MREKDGKVILFPGGDPPQGIEAANDDDAGAECAGVLAHRVKYGLRFILSIVLMWLQGPLGFVCHLLSLLVWAAFLLLLIFKGVWTGPLWLLAGIGFLLFLVPLLFEFLVYWVMPTK